MKVDARRNHAASAALFLAFIASADFLKAIGRPNTEGFAANWLTGHLRRAI